MTSLYWTLRATGKRSSARSSLAIRVILVFALVLASFFPLVVIGAQDGPTRSVHFRCDVCIFNGPPVASLGFGPRACRSNEERRLYLVTAIKFNPRPCTGRNLKGAHEFTFPIRVSIHAPARGETRGWRRMPRWWWSVSIHAPARGETSRPPGCRRHPSGFNPRPCTGRNMARLCTCRLPHTCFNPRPCTGRNQQAVSERVTGQGVSIHAPARGETFG